MVDSLVKTAGGAAVCAARVLVEKVASIDVEQIKPGTAMAKLAALALHDQAYAFDVGFMKAAADVGFSQAETLTAYNMLCEQLQGT